MRPEVKRARSRFETQKRMKKLRPDTVCKRCGMSLEEHNALGKGQLQMHHVHAIEDGGDPVDPENIHTLCYFCHKEWHTYWETFHPDYGEFMQAPPFRPCPPRLSTS